MIFLVLLKIFIVSLPFRKLVFISKVLEIFLIKLFGCLSLMSVNMKINYFHKQKVQEVIKFLHSSDFHKIHLLQLQHHLKKLPQHYFFFLFKGKTAPIPSGIALETIGTLDSIPLFGSNKCIDPPLPPVQPSEFP